MRSVLKTIIFDLLALRHQWVDGVYFSLFAVLMVTLFHFTGVLNPQTPLTTVVGLWWTVMTMTIFLWVSPVWSDQLRQGIWDYRILENTSLVWVVGIKMAMLSVMLVMLGMVLFAAWMVFYPGLIDVSKNFLISVVLTIPCVVFWVGLAASLCGYHPRAKVVLMLILLPWIVPVLIVSHVFMIGGDFDSNLWGLSQVALLQLMMGFFLVSVVCSVWGSSYSLRLAVSEHES